MEQLQEALKNPMLRLPLMLGIAAGAVVTIAGGFFITYKVLVFLGIN